MFTRKVLYHGWQHIVLMHVIMFINLFYILSFKICKVIKSLGILTNLKVVNLSHNNNRLS